MSDDPQNGISSFIGSDTFRNTVAFLVLASSATAAYFSFKANDEAAEAARLAREADRQLKIIDQALDRDELATTLMSESLPYFEKMKSSDPDEAVSACHVIVILSTFQIEATQRRHIHDLALRISDEGVVDPSGLCREAQSKSEFAARVAEQEKIVANEDVSADIAKLEIRAMAEKAVLSDLEVATSENVPNSIGKFHAVMASYQANNCKLAQTSARVFSEAFHDQLQEDGKAVSIYLTTISNHYAVVIDSDDRRSVANEWVRFLREKGLEAEDRIKRGNALRVDRENIRYLTGAFLQENRGWVIDPNCTAG